MVCHARSASLAPRRRRQQIPKTPSLPPLAVLDLGKPAERDAYDFLCRATSKRDRIWHLFGLRRLGGTLLCVVRWCHASDSANPFSLAEVSLTEIAVFWQYYPSLEAARAELIRRCTDVPSQEGQA